jgi:type IV pilus assembly protein PilC
MKFNFKAKDKKGELKEGSVDAANNEAAIEVLQQNGLFPIYVGEVKEGDALVKSFLKYFDRVNDKELMVFFKQLSILIEAKVPIVASLTAIKDETENLYFRKILEEAIGDIQDGLPLSDALKKHKNVFSALSTNIIKAGEVSGNLKKSVDYVAKNIEKNYVLYSKIRSAMMYPAIILVVFCVIGFLFLTFIIPKLTSLVKSLSVTLPWYTQAVIALTDYMAKYWWANILIIIGIVSGFLYYIRTDNGKRDWDEIKLKIPIIGPIFQKLYIARFADNLNVLLEGGLPIIRSIILTSSVVNNSVYQGLILKMADEVKIGGSMSDVLGKSDHIPPIVSQMVKIGEESGEIDLVLRYIAKFYEQEVDVAAKNLSTLIEPILMIVIGVAVGVLVFMILMPIYDVASQL